MTHLRLATRWLCLLATAVASLAGCSRTRYRLQADRDAYCAIAERNGDPRWAAESVNIDMDPRSRFFENENVDCPPIPIDDPASHQYMHRVDGKRGWKHWHRNGERVELENPIWYDALGEFSGFSKEGALRVDLEIALELAYTNSPLHQRQLETLYLASLDVSAERFRLDTQFFGGYDAFYSHNGSLVPASLSFDQAANRYVVSPPFDGVESNRLTIGRPDGGNPALQVSRRFATAGELLVGFANSFVFEFTGANANLSASLLNFSFVQPLLRGAGRDRALEALTLAERNLLANLRAYGQFRQGFFTQVAIGELGVSNLQRGGFGTSLQSFGGFGGVDGYFGLLRQLQQIRNSEAILRLQERTLARLEAVEKRGAIDRGQVEQFRQNIQDLRDSLLRARAQFELSLDRFKTSTLGLPPDLEIIIDDSLLTQFQLVPVESTSVQSMIFELQERLASLGAKPAVEDLRLAMEELTALHDEVYAVNDTVREDLSSMRESMTERSANLSPDEASKLEEDRETLFEAQRDKRKEFDKMAADLREIQQSLSNPSADTQDLRVAAIGWTTDLLDKFEQAVLIQARARLEVIDVPDVRLHPVEASQIALENRLDFMNGRAALVDSWRRIQIAADQLQSVLNIRASGDLRTARNNPVSFRAPTGSARVGVEFDAPFTRLLERNGYREALINYQRDRRTLIQSHDNLKLGLRALLRNLEQQRASLELQRRSVAIAIMRADLTQKRLADPQRNGAGAGQGLSQATAINILSAQASLLNSQNSFLNVWLSYLATRIRLYRELGIMSLDRDGQWMEYPLPESLMQENPLDQRLLQNGFESRLPSSSPNSPPEVPQEIPPELPGQFIDLMEHIPDAPVPVGQVSWSELDSRSAVQAIRFSAVPELVIPHESAD